MVIEHCAASGGQPGSALANQAFLAGDSAMAARMRAHEWSATPLGATERWPQALRTAVRLLLNTGHPMYIFWGPQLACLYNDAYARSIGPERHPSSLGRPAYEVWAETWDVIAPQIEQVMAGSGATWHENQLVPITRHGRREDVWWTYSFGPIDDETAPGGVGGVLVVCTETTEPVMAQRRQAFQLALTETLQRLADPAARMDAACAVLGEQLGVAQVGFGEIHADGEYLSVARDWNDGRIGSVVGTWRMDDFGAEFIRDMKAGRTVAIPDVAQDPRTCAPVVLRAYESIRTRAILDVPLVRDGHLLALLFIHNPEPRAWSAAEISLVEDTCARLWGAVGEARIARALVESERRARAQLAELRSIYQATPVGLAVFDRTLRFVRVNERLAQINGIPADVHIGRTVRELFPDLADAAETALRTVLETGKALRDIEFVGTTPAHPGVERVRIEQWLPLRDDDGHIIGVHVLVEEVTERRRSERERERMLGAERSARARTEQLQAFTAALAAARTREEVARAAVESGCLAVGTTKGKLYLIEQGTTQSQALVLAHGTGYAPSVLEQLQRIPNTAQTAGGEAIARRCEIYVESRAEFVARYPLVAAVVEPRELSAVVAHPLMTGSGPAARALGFLAFDFEHDRALDADEKRFVAALAQVAAQALDRTLAAEALAESEARFRVLADTMPQIIWATRPDGYHDYFNERWYEYTGMPRPHEPGGSYDPTGTGLGWRWTDYLHPDDQAATFAAWSHSLATGAPYYVEYRFKRHDNAWRWFIGRALAQRDESGRVARWFGTLTDIDDAKRTAQERDALIERLTDADRRKDEFLAMLAHELRNPLAPLTNALRFVERHEPLGELGRRSLAMAERQTLQLKRLVDDILEVSRITRGKIELRPERVSVSAVIRDVVEAARAGSTARTQTVVADLPHQPLWIEADPVRLAQMLGNLLGNACKFTPPGGRIDLGVVEHDTHIEIRVTDTGIGIDQAKIGGLFELFHQVDPTLDRSHGGLGIGLALVKRLAVLHGGSVRAESAGLGCGATFVLDLPRRLAGPTAT